MPRGYVGVTREEMDKFLRRTFRALRPTPNDRGGELIYTLRLSQNVGIKVLTSIAAGGQSGASSGEDAIRVIFISLKRPYPRDSLMGKARSKEVGKSRVHRTENWRTNLKKLVQLFIQKYHEKLDYWEHRATADLDNPDAPSEKQIAYTLQLIREAPVSNWGGLGIEAVVEKPTADSLSQMDKKDVSRLIEKLKELSTPQPSAPTEDVEVTFARLRDGDWGIRGYGLEEGNWVTVVKKNGQKTRVQVGEVLYTYPDGKSLARIGGQSRRYAGELGEPNDFDVYGEVPQ